MFPMLLLASSLTAFADTPQQRLTITATTPKVSVPPLEAGRQFVPLPALDYRFLLEPRCSKGWQVQSVSLSIADSRQVFQTDMIDAHGFVNANLSVPAAQLAPVPVSGFCEAAVGGEAPTDEAAGNTELRIGAALSAHAALICVNEESERVSYTSRPLAVILRCKPPEVEPLADPAEDPVATNLNPATGDLGETAT